MSNNYRKKWKDLKFSLPEKPPVVDRTNCTKCKKCKQIGVKAYPNADHWGRCIDCDNEARTPINWMVALKDFALWVAMALCFLAFNVPIFLAYIIAITAAWMLMWWPLWLLAWLMETQK